ncbi:DinB family protein [Larkinella rosea]|uniref:DinB family protein n=1 Tax=Larkinella rosea TaxID=2025312 RepID=A0A3P1BCV2_9BACT|nr:DinB family protein [Larkinella rosea]RRA98602.1 DinB family protein [Larkinella rosea]
MENQLKTPAIPSEEVFVKMAIAAWDTQTKRITTLLDKLSDEALLAEVAPGRNRGIYLLGHLIAVNDGMLPLLGFGDKLYPQLATGFITTPDKSGIEFPTVSELRSYWHTLNATLSQHIEALQPEDWFAKHTAVTDEDFARDPIRNKLNVLINRTNHQSYHLGQLVFLL